MHGSRARVRWVAGLMGMAAVACAMPAHAEAQVKPVGVYRLKVTPEHGVATEKRLRCRPDGGTLHAASRACDQLEAADGDVGRIPAQPGMCTLEMAPVRVTAEGTWRGRPRHFARDYPNRCLAVRDTGGILFQ
ncbi:subtilisin inhibitor-like [Actinomadura pelletieri DSM 43383]|uniref:Subtilisin inhibitor-like n=1 Tax=Actinomadura pelletieri DSM 43383 TaxID=1120940 RepID=A0A495QAW1_9ACTN|nr:SSI family serine proteinase inhibitor [Actinomadura pelletieri]RKS68832.1 subtilisin inhibitor-like [Actinomadura pelletieri DSM 43383]